MMILAAIVSLCDHGTHSLVLTAGGQVNLAIWSVVKEAIRVGSPAMQEGVLSLGFQSCLVQNVTFSMLHSCLKVMLRSPIRSSALSQHMSMVWMPWPVGLKLQ